MYNGSGLFNIDSTGQPVAASTLIQASVFNALTADLATGLSTAITKDGQTTITANLPMSGYRHTGVGNASARTMYAAAGQVQDGSLCHGTVGGTANAITLTLTPAITAYAAGQKFSFIAGGTNTTAVTINVNSVGAKSITKNGTTALAAGDIASGAVCVVVYDGTQFQLLGQMPSALTGLLSFKAGSDIASSATVDLGTATGNSVTVTHSTGTTAITSLGGASLQAGTEIETIFSISGGTLTITHHPTNLYLAGGANITLANGDVIRWRKMHDSNAEWKMVGGVKADGTAWVASNIPAGTVIWFAANSPPSGFLKANGAAVSRTTYAALFAAIGTTYGVGDGATTFNLPDLRGEFVRGLDDGRGVDSGRGIGTAQADDVKSHNHTIPQAALAVASGGNSGAGAGAGYATANTGGTETRPRNIALLACIKF